MPFTVIGLVLLVAASLQSPAQTLDSSASILRDPQQEVQHPQHLKALSAHAQKKRSLRDASLERSILSSAGLPYPATDPSSADAQTLRHPEQQSLNFRRPATEGNEGSVGDSADQASSNNIDPLSDDKLRLVDLALTRLEQNLARERESRKRHLQTLARKASKGKRPSFSPWAGRKRTVEQVQTWPLPEQQVENVEKQSSSHHHDGGNDRLNVQTLSGWNGRDTGSSSNRIRFDSYFGKGSGHLGNDKFDKRFAKRNPFCSWCGKRATKRPSFNPWHGKRSTLQVSQDKSSTFTENFGGTLTSGQSGKPNSEPGNTAGNFPFPASDDQIRLDSFDFSEFAYPHSSSARPLDMVEKPNIHFPDENNEKDSWMNMYDILTALGIENISIEQLADIISSHRRTMEERETEVNYERTESNADEIDGEKDEYIIKTKRQSFSPWKGKRHNDHPSFLSSNVKRSVLDDVNFGEKTLRAALKSQQRRQILKALQQLYKRIVNRRASMEETGDPITEEITADSAQDFNTGSKQDNTESNIEHDDSKIRSFEEPHSKRPAFHSWAGKRDSLIHNVRRKRSSNLSHGPRAKYQKSKDAQTVNNGPSTSASSAEMTETSAGLSSPEPSKPQPTLENKDEGSQKNDGNLPKEQNQHGFSEGLDKTNLRDAKMNSKEEMPGEMTAGDAEKGRLEKDLEEKRTRGFSAWHGKRSFSQDDTGDKGSMTVAKGTLGHDLDAGENKESKRSRGFSAWHGKRNGATLGVSLEPTGRGQTPNHRIVNGKLGEDLNKRDSAFHWWRGKRTGYARFSPISLTEREAPLVTEYPIEMLGPELSSPDVFKRPAFHAWSGKRSDRGVDLGVLLPYVEAAQQQLEQPAYLKQQQQYFLLYPTVTTQDSHFKLGTSEIENPMEPDVATNSLKAENDGEFPTSLSSMAKRPGFSAWHGKKKRSEEDTIRSESQVDKRPAFHAWSGKKRAPVEAMTGSLLHKRPYFHAWNGKKRKREETFVPVTVTAPRFNTMPMLPENTPDLVLLTNRPFSSDSHSLRLDLPVTAAYRSLDSENGPDQVIFPRVPFVTRSHSKRLLVPVWSGTKQSSLLPLRRFYPAQEQESIVQPVKRPAFHAWSGKRGGLESGDSPSPATKTDSRP